MKRFKKYYEGVFDPASKEDRFERKMMSYYEQGSDAWHIIRAYSDKEKEALNLYVYTEMLPVENLLKHLTANPSKPYGHGISTGQIEDYNIQMYDNIYKTRTKILSNKPFDQTFIDKYIIGQ